MRAAGASGDLQLTGELNWAFHRQINYLGRSDKLLALIRSVASSVPRASGDQVQVALVETIGEKAEILRAMSERRVDDVENLARCHFEGLAPSVVEFLRDKGLVEE